MATWVRLRPVLRAVVQEANPPASAWRRSSSTYNWPTKRSLAVPTGTAAAAELLVKWLLSPLKDALKEWMPTGRLEVVKAALPPLRENVARVVPWSRNVTKPVSVPTPDAPGVTVA